MAENLGVDLETISIDTFTTYMQVGIPFNGYVNELGFARWDYVDYHMDSYTQTLDLEEEARRIQKQLEKEREEARKEEEKIVQKNDSFRYNIEVKRDAIKANNVEDKEIIEIKGKELEYQRILRGLTAKLSYVMKRYKEDISSNAISTLSTATSITATAFKNSIDNAVKNCRYGAVLKSEPLSKNINYVKVPFSRWLYMDKVRAEKIVDLSSKWGKRLSFAAFVVIGYNVLSNRAIKKSCWGGEISLSKTYLMFLSYY